MDERERIIAEIHDLQRDTARLIHGCLPREWLDAEITMPQFKAMVVLFGLGKASMGELADALGTGVSTVTGIVDRLVDHGLVSREEAPYDRRVVVGRLTPRGQALVERLYLAAKDRHVATLNQLSLEELRLVARASSLLRDAANRAFPSGVATASTVR
ncbi:MAG TPA: MarR family transcriptional regulator [Chloroflexota bacterium]|nr:MarR family transcriptional regulator [Chloroflexota bacterium]